MDYLDIQKNDVPCLYELSFQSDPIAVLVRIRSEGFAQLSPVTEENQTIKRHLASGHAKKYTRMSTGTFGYDDVLSIEHRDADWVTVSAPIPSSLIAKQVCRSCQGSGKKSTDGFDEKCWSCCGDGFLAEFGNPNVWQVSHSLEWLFCQLACCKPSANGITCQLLTLGLAHMEDEHFSPAFIEGWFSNRLTQWLVKIGAYETFPSVITAMQDTYVRLYDIPKHVLLNHQEFEAQSSNGNIMLSCQGNRCGINPEPYALSAVTEGYPFGCHNVDSLEQQLTLLAGLAALHDLARKAGI